MEPVTRQVTKQVQKISLFLYYLTKSDDKAVFELSQKFSLQIYARQFMTS